MIMNVIMKGHKYTSELSKTKQSETKQVSALDAMSLICKRLLKTVCMAFWGKKLRLLVA